MGGNIMSREPSIHITEKNLILVLNNIFNAKTIILSNIDKLAKQILTSSKPYSINSRNVIVNNQKLEKATNKLVKSSRLDADVMANLIVNVRRQLKHRGIQQILPNTRDWNLVKSLTKLANDFCNEFELEQREGYLNFLKIGISRMNKFGLVKLTNMYELICSVYDSRTQIQKDGDSEGTRDIHDYYFKKVLEKTGIPESYIDKPEKYLYFLKVNEESKKLGLKGTLWIEAQFWGLEWNDGKPEPPQLIGDKALERVTKYCYKHKVQAKEVSIDFKKLRG